MMAVRAVAWLDGPEVHALEPGQTVQGPSIEAVVGEERLARPLAPVRGVLPDTAGSPALGVALVAGEKGELAVERAGHGDTAAEIAALGDVARPVHLAG